MRRTLCVVCFGLLLLVGPAGCSGGDSTLEVVGPVVTIDAGAVWPDESGLRSGRRFCSWRDSGVCPDGSDVWAVPAPFFAGRAPVISVYVFSEGLGQWVLLPAQLKTLTTWQGPESFVSIGDTVLTLWNCGGRRYQIGAISF